MKLSESWLREWVNPSWTREALCQQLTMAGLEVESCVADNNQYILEVAITPNRGDCLSVQGIARELSALSKIPMQYPAMPEIPASIKDTLPMHVKVKAECPRYIGRVVRHIKANATTPAWIEERLRHAGIRAISPIVDITNYVMLELGQPMHAFDLQTIEKGIEVRKAKAGEKLSLLDGSEKILDSETVVIADQRKPLAIAGVMGGLDSGVTLLTQDIFLESAFFSALGVARQRQHYALSSESSFRFERGVDPALQRKAIERATALILEIAGGEAGPVVEVVEAAALPKAATIILRSESILQVLGITIADKTVESILQVLGFSCQREKQHWLVQAPSYRLDITLEEDLIEEIARIHGYDNIPLHNIQVALQGNTALLGKKDLSTYRQILRDHGYHEMVSYSFISKQLQQQLDPGHHPHELVNPITADMTVMRTNLWPGLMNALQYNQNRQQQRVQLFEIGTCFTPEGEKTCLGGLFVGSAYPEQWGLANREGDFFDVKGTLESLLAIIYPQEIFSFQSGSHPALHPGQTAFIYQGERKLGVIGSLHPSLLKPLDVIGKVILFELYIDQLLESGLPHFMEISKFPEIRRDIAILVNQTVPSQVIQDTIKRVAGDWLKEIFIFDVYQGKGIAQGYKSVALGLILQHPTRTLVDEEIATCVERVTVALQEQLGAQLRR